MQLFFNMLLAHLVGDFYLQTDKSCEAKRKGIGSVHHYIHALVIFAVSMLLSNDFQSFWLYALVIALAHLVVDCLKSYVRKRDLAAFCVDQLLHIAVLMAVVWFYLRQHPSWSQFAFLPDARMVVAACCLIVCCKPANILIKLVLERYRIEVPASKGRELNNAGALIGCLERVLCLVFVVLNQYEAIGFVIAAKSILRFKDGETAKTEYVLVGTLLSFGIAIAAGLALKYVII